jgi:predicted PurR-regulated permease PerM
MGEHDGTGQRRSTRVHAGTAATIVIAVIATILALALGRALLVPITLSLVLAALLEPVVAGLRRLSVPAPVGATLAVVATLVLLTAGGAALEPPLRSFAETVPSSIAKARAELARAAARFEPNAAAPRAGSPAPTAPAAGPPGGVTGVISRAFGTTASLLLEWVEILLLALLLLAAGDGWRDKLTAAVRSADRRRAALDAAREMAATVRRYLLVTALINLGQGVLVALVVWLAGLPSPTLWGVLTFVAEFVPYLGGATLVALLFVVGVATTDSLGRALIAPAGYLAITTLQNNLVSPIAYGRNLCLAPAAVLAAVMFWWVVWGVGGAFLAVPILAAVHVLARHVDALRPVGVFIEG